MTSTEFRQMIRLMSEFSVHFESLAAEQQRERNEAKSKILIRAVDMLMDDNKNPAHRMFEF